MDYINRLSNYDMPDIATIAVGSELYEEARDLQAGAAPRGGGRCHRLHQRRARDRVRRASTRRRRVMLGRAQLAQQLVDDAMGSFIKANDATEYLGVINAADAAGARRSRCAARRSRRAHRHVAHLRVLRGLQLDFGGRIQYVASATPGHVRGGEDPLQLDLELLAPAWSPRRAPGRRRRCAKANSTRT